MLACRRRGRAASPASSAGTTLVNHPGPDGRRSGSRRLSARAGGLRRDRRWSPSSSSASSPARSSGARPESAGSGALSSPRARRPPRGGGRRGRASGPPLRAVQGASRIRAEHAAKDTREPRQGPPAQRRLERPLAAVGERRRRVRERARPGEGRRLVRGLVGAARDAAGFRQGRALALPGVAGRARDRGLLPHRRAPSSPGSSPAASARSRERARSGSRSRRVWRGLPRLCLRGGDRLDVGADRRLRGRHRAARPADLARDRGGRRVRRAASRCAGTSRPASRSPSPASS